MNKMPWKSVVFLHRYFTSFQLGNPCSCVFKS